MLLDSNRKKVPFLFFFSMFGFSRLLDDVKLLFKVLCVNLNAFIESILSSLITKLGTRKNQFCKKRNVKF